MIGQQLAKDIWPFVACACATCAISSRSLTSPINILLSQQSYWQRKWHAMTNLLQTIQRLLWEGERQDEGYACATQIGLFCAYLRLNLFPLPHHSYFYIMSCAHHLGLLKQRLRITSENGSFTLSRMFHIPRIGPRLGGCLLRASFEGNPR